MFLGFDLWPLKVIWSWKNIPFESPYMTSFLTSMDTISLSCTIFELFDFKIFKVWAWPLTFENHLGSKKLYYSKAHIWLPIWFLWTPWISLSRTVSEIFDFKVLRVWPWPLTFKSHLVSQKCIPFGRSYMTFYMTSIDNISLSRTVFEIFDLKVFRVWPRTLTHTGHLESKYYIPFESPCITSYLTSMDIISPSRTVFEIFDFKVFSFWSWPLTPKGHLGSKIFIIFESPYMTSYLTSMNTISLSCAVFEIFNFKVFRVWPWPLGPEGHLGSKIFIIFESPCMTSYLINRTNHYIWIVFYLTV